MTTLTLEPATDGQLKQLGRVGSDAVEKSLKEFGLDKEGAQRVHARGDELAAVIARATTDALKDLSVTDKYKNEERKSTYGYLSGYRKPVEVSDQIDILRTHWPKLNPDNAIRYAREVYPTFQLPNWIEGPFALIRPGFFSENYGEEVEEVLKALKKDRKGRFVNYRENELGPDRLRQTVRTTSALARILEQQPGSDIIVVPGQFGILHRGRSVRRAREVYVAPEFGFGAKDGGTMVLTNPIRLQHYDDLWIDLGGDEYHDPQDSVAPFDRAPYLGFRGDRLRFGTRRVDRARGYCGSASGVAVPQS